MKEDKRPEPKARKNPELWQAYLWWDELMQMQKRHKLRLSSIEKEKSNLLADFEQDILAQLSPMVNLARKDLAVWGKTLGPVWDWMVSIKGVGDHTAAKILAQFDDVGKFATISKFWRFSGWAVIDGKIDKCEKGVVSPYNRRLKSECYLIAENFIRQQTPVYADLYYQEKSKQKDIHPSVLCRTCTGKAVREKRTEYELNTVVLHDMCDEHGAMMDELDKQYGKYAVKWDDCTQKKKHKRQFNDGHLHARAMRKTVKIFLSHLWQVWRESEGLSVSQPWIADIGGHSNIVPIPNWPL